MKASPTPTKPKMTTLASLIIFGVFVAGCGGGGGGGPTSGSQSVTPSSSTTTAATAGESASGAASSASAATVTTVDAGASAASNAATTVKSSDTPISNSGTPAQVSSAAANAGVVAASPIYATNPTQTANATSKGSDTSTATASTQAAGADVPTATAAAAVAAESLATVSALQGRIDRLKSAIDSMKVSQHEVKPACSPCAGWGVKPLVVMGTEPYASALPTNWPGIKFAEWKAMLSWFVIYEGSGGSPAKNSVVEVRGIEMWYLSKSSKTWKLVQSGQVPKWDSTVATDAVTLSATSALRVSSPTSITYLPTATNVVHGGLPQTDTPWNTSVNKADIDAIYVSIRHRLALKSASGIDDRAGANFVLEAGIDYYPYMGARVSDLKASYVPGAGLGQFIKVSTQWRYSTVFLRSNAISEAQLLTIQPPAFIY